MTKTMTKTKKRPANHPTVHPVFLKSKRARGERDWQCWVALACETTPDMVHLLTLKRGKRIAQQYRARLNDITCGRAGKRAVQRGRARSIGQIILADPPRRVSGVSRNGRRNKYNPDGSLKS